MERPAKRVKISDVVPSTIRDAASRIVADLFGPERSITGQGEQDNPPFVPAPAVHIHELRHRSPHSEAQRRPRQHLPRQAGVDLAPRAPQEIDTTSIADTAITDAGSTIPSIVAVATDATVVSLASESVTAPAATEATSVINTITADTSQSVLASATSAPADITAVITASTSQSAVAPITPSSFNTTSIAVTSSSSPAVTISSSPSVTSSGSLSVTSSGSPAVTSSGSLNVISSGSVEITSSGSLAITSSNSRTITVTQASTLQVSTINGTLVTYTNTQATLKSVGSSSSNKLTITTDRTTTRSGSGLATRTGSGTGSGSTRTSGSVRASGSIGASGSGKGSSAGATATDSSDSSQVGIIATAPATTTDYYQSGSAGQGGATASTTITSSSAASSSASSGSGSESSGPGLSPAQQQTIGGVVGGVAGIAVVLVVLLFVLKWYRSRLKNQGRLPEQLAAQASNRGISHGDNMSMSQRSSGVPLAAAIASSFKRMRPQSQGSGLAASTAPDSEKGFQRIAGRKIPTVLGPGTGPRGDGFGGNYGAFEKDIAAGPGDGLATHERNLASTSFYRDSGGSFGGQDTSSAPTSPTFLAFPAPGRTQHRDFARSPQSNPNLPQQSSDLNLGHSSRPEGYAAIRASPARTPVMNSPSSSSIALPIQHMTALEHDKDAPPTPQIPAGLGLQVPGSRDGVGRSLASQDGSRVSRVSRSSHGSRGGRFVENIV